MYYYTKFTATLVLLSSCWQNAFAISCYECNSKNNTMCLDPTLYDKDTIDRYLRPTDCSNRLGRQQDFFCRKIIQTVIHKGYEPEVRVTRGCGWVKHHRECYKADTDDHLETVCQCFSDGCNGASNIYYIWTLFTTLALTGLAMKI